MPGAFRWYGLNCAIPKNRSCAPPALNHVVITDPEDSMEIVKARSAVLESLRKKGLIRISYSLPAYVQSDYNIYYRSKLYELLCHTVLEAQGKPGFLFNLPAMRFGQVFPL